MNDMKFMKKSKIPIKGLIIEDAFIGILTYFHRKLNALTIHYKVKSKTLINFRTNFKRRCYS